MSTEIQRVIDASHRAEKLAFATQNIAQTIPQLARAFDKKTNDHSVSGFLVGKKMAKSK